jgi:hypothetical protein
MRWGVAYYRGSSHVVQDLEGNYPAARFTPLVRDLGRSGRIVCTVVSVPRPFRLSASGRNKIHPSIHPSIHRFTPLSSPLIEENMIQLNHHFRTYSLQERESICPVFLMYRDTWYFLQYPIGLDLLQPRGK